MKDTAAPAARQIVFDHAGDRRTFWPADCPRCGEEHDIWPEVGLVPYGLYCRACQWGGPRVAIEDDDPEPAIAAWNDEARKVAMARDLGLTLNLVQPKEDADETC